MEVEALVRLCKRTAAARQVGRGRIGEGMCKGVILVVQVDPIEPNVLTEPLFVARLITRFYFLVSCCTCLRFFAGRGRQGVANGTSRSPTNAIAWKLKIGADAQTPVPGKAPPLLSTTMPRSRAM